MIQDSGVNWGLGGGVSCVRPVCYREVVLAQEKGEFASPLERVPKSAFASASGFAQRFLAPLLSLYQGEDPRHDT